MAKNREGKKGKKSRRGLKITALVLGIIAVAWGLCAVLPKPKAMKDNPLMIEKGARPLHISHGGGNGEFPDNTLEAFYNAYNIDSGTMMETDVSMTKDGVILLSHDTTIDRKTNKSGDIKDWNYYGPDGLIEKRVDFNYHNSVTPSSNGYRPDPDDESKLVRYKTKKTDDAESRTVLPKDAPCFDAAGNFSYPDDPDIAALNFPARDPEIFLATTLEQLIVLFPENYINVEIKQSGEVGLDALAKIMELLAKHNAKYNTYGRIVLASFHKEIYDKIGEYKKDIPQLLYSPQQSGIVKFFILQAVGLDVFYADKAAVFQVPVKQSGITLGKKGFIRHCHNHNIAVHFWTINDPDEMRMLCDNGADGIMTDVPTVLKKILDEKYPAA